VEDGSHYVKLALAESLCDIGARLPANETLNHVLPILGQLLRDEVPEVRMELIKHVNKLNESLGPLLISERIVPALINLSRDPNWRVRLNVVEYAPNLADVLEPAMYK